MPKSTFLDFSPIPEENREIAGIGIMSTSPIRNFDNAFRTIMAILRRDLDKRVVLASKAADYTAGVNDNNAAFRFTAPADWDGENWSVDISEMTDGVGAGPQ